MSVIGQGLQRLADWFSGAPVEQRRGRMVRDNRMTWKVVKLDGPIQKSLGLNADYGVIISSTVMMRETQTMLFCPLINGLDAQGRELAMFPWHVVVNVTDKNAPAKVEFARKLVSTKIVLPISPDEIDRDGLDRGRLDIESQRRMTKVLRAWLPGYNPAIF